MSDVKEQQPGYKLVNKYKDKYTNQLKYPENIKTIDDIKICLAHIIYNNNLEKFYQLIYFNKNFP